MLEQEAQRWERQVSWAYIVRRANAEIFLAFHDKLKLGELLIFFETLIEVQ